MATAAGDSGFERQVAIKRIRGDLAGDPATCRMFLDEARIASQLHHPNIVGVLDYGILDAIPFQVLEFVDGIDCRALIGRAGPMPPEVALYLCTEVAHGLAYAHAVRDLRGRSLGIVHRDVSPANILVSFSGAVKLSDFGIAVARDRSERTRTGVSKGTLPYMAPEQMVQGAVDERTDVFALGCVLHAMVTGESPLVDDVPLDLLAGVEIPLAPDIDEELRPIIARATRRSKDERFRDAGEMAGTLGTALVRRVDRDPRSVLLAWLDHLAPARGRRGDRPLDDLLDLELVLAGETPRDREFRSVPAARQEASAPGSAVHGPARRPTRRPRARRPRLARAGIVLAFALVLGVAGGTALLLSRPGAEPTAEAGKVVSATAATAAAIEPPPADAGAGPDPSPPPPADGEDPGPEESEVRARSPARARPRPPAAAPRADSSTGVVAIGGAGAQRAAILVNGARQGFAPRRLDLPVGIHRVELLTPAGERLHRRLSVGAHHTPSRPLRWIVPAAGSAEAVPAQQVD